MQLTLTIPGEPIAQPRIKAKMKARSNGWSQIDIAWLRDNYPSKGKLACAVYLSKTEASVRWQASHLGLKVDRSSEFFKEWQRRAAVSKVGKKRPDQAKVMIALHAAGKLAQTPQQRAQGGLKLSELWKKRGHPRGALGMRHSSKALQAISQASRRAWKTMTPQKKRQRSVKIMETRAAKGMNAPDRIRGTWKAGWRTIGGTPKFYRSRWEANYASYLEWRRLRGEIIKWEHEPETFWFRKIKRGSVSYLPDFRVTNLDGFVEYHEVKGWMDSRSKTKIRRMAKYHPTVRLRVITGKEYRQIEKTISTIIPGWESPPEAAL